jgi:hypothetical protein
MASARVFCSTQVFGLLSAIEKVTITVLVSPKDFSPEFSRLMRGKIKNDTSSSFGDIEVRLHNSLHNRSMCDDK